MQLASEIVSSVELSVANSSRCDVERLVLGSRRVLVMTLGKLKGIDVEISHENGNRAVCIMMREGKLKRNLR